MRAEFASSKTATSTPCSTATSTAPDDASGAAARRRTHGARRSRRAEGSRFPRPAVSVLQLRPTAEVVPPAERPRTPLAVRRSASTMAAAWDGHHVDLDRCGSPIPGYGRPIRGFAHKASSMQPSATGEDLTGRRPTSTLRDGRGLPRPRAATRRRLASGGEMRDVVVRSDRRRHRDHHRLGAAPTNGMRRAPDRRNRWRGPERSMRPGGGRLWAYRLGKLHVHASPAPAAEAGPGRSTSSRRRAALVGDGGSARRRRWHGHGHGAGDGRTVGRTSCAAGGSHRRSGGRSSLDPWSSWHVVVISPHGKGRRCGMGG